MKPNLTSDQQTTHGTLSALDCLYLGDSPKVAMNYSLNILPSVAPAMQRLEQQWNNCSRCIIGEWRKHVVYARGTVPCDVLFLLESPKKEDDLVGLAGISRQVRNGTQKMIDVVQQQKPFTYAFTNLIACRPSDTLFGPNRIVREEEVINCRPRLVQFLVEVAKPKAVVFLGKMSRTYGPEWDGLHKLYLNHPTAVEAAGREKSRMFADDLHKLEMFIKKELAHVIPD